MNSHSLGKPVLLVLAVTILGYALVFGWIEHRRVRQGPWQVTFTTAANGAPALIINQPRVGVTNVQLVFPGASPASGPAAELMLFAAARPVPFDLPFGQCVFQDTTFLPGTVVIQAFGHEIQLLPRVLTLDHAEHPWRSGEVIILSNKPAPATSAQ